jgi:hypothetical protein
VKLHCHRPTYCLTLLCIAATNSNDNQGKLTIKLDDTVCYWHMYVTPDVLNVTFGDFHAVLQPTQYSYVAHTRQNMNLANALIYSCMQVTDMSVWLAQSDAQPSTSVLVQ